MNNIKYDTELVRTELLEVLKKHKIPVLLASDILRTLNRDLICYFNTADIQPKYYGADILKRILAESDIGGKVNGRRISWSEINSLNL